MQEAPFREPAALVHQLALQQGDLPGRPAEAHPAQLEPETGGLGEAHRADGSSGHGLGQCGHDQYQGTGQRKGVWAAAPQVLAMGDQPLVQLAGTQFTPTWCLNQWQVMQTWRLRVLSSTASSR